MAEANGMGPQHGHEFLQADNEMRTFAKESGGLSFFPRFLGEYPASFASSKRRCAINIRSPIIPTNTAQDGKFRHIKVELINPETNEPLRLNNAKGKAMKYQVIAKAGYKAPHEVE